MLFLHFTNLLTPHFLRQSDSSSSTSQDMAAGTRGASSPLETIDLMEDDQESVGAGATATSASAQGLYSEFQFLQYFMCV